MGWRVKRNDLPTIIVRLPREVDDSVQEFADDLATAIEDRVWVDTGMIRRNTEVYEQGEYFAAIGVGWYLGQGFYSGFQEFGTVHQGARPVVVPVAHESEPVFANYVEKAIKKACGA